MLLMLVMIGAFIAASQAITCFFCAGCDDPFSPSSSSQTCEGDLCSKAQYKSGDSDVTARGCAAQSAGSTGCKSASYEGQSGTVCYCDTDKCNGATMTSSFGHVITAVALIISVVIGYLLWALPSAWCWWWWFACHWNNNRSFMALVVFVVCSWLTYSMYPSALILLFLPHNFTNES